MRMWACLLVVATVPMVHADDDEAMRPKWIMDDRDPWAATAETLCQPETQAKAAAQSAIDDSRNFDRGLDSRRALYDQAYRLEQQRRAGGYADEQEEERLAIEYKSLMEAYAEGRRRRARAVAAADELRRADADLAECREEAGRRYDARMAVMSKRTVDELRVIPERYRLRDEQERIDAADRAVADAAERARIARGTQAKWMAPILSAYICNVSSNRAETLRDVATEKKYAREVGARPSELRLIQYQDRLRELDGILAALRLQIRRVRGKQMPCTGSIVAALRECIDQDGDGCETGTIAAYWAVNEFVKLPED